MNWLKVLRSSNCKGIGNDTDSHLWISSFCKSLISMFKCVWLDEFWQHSRSVQYFKPSPKQAALTHGVKVQAAILQLDCCHSHLHGFYESMGVRATSEYHYSYRYSLHRKIQRITDMIIVQYVNIRIHLRKLRISMKRSWLLLSLSRQLLSVASKRIWNLLHHPGSKTNS